MTTAAPDTSDVIYFQCPRCKEQRVRLERPIRYSAIEFCPGEKCDFPLFWTKEAEELMARPTAAPPSTPVAEVPPAAPRALPTVACPRCGTANHEGATYCSACRAALQPRPPDPADVWWKLAAVIAASGVLAVVAWLLALLFG